MSSNSNIMSIQEMIDKAFGEADKNIVNFKLIHSILYILARQLRLLQRKVEVEISPFPEPVSSTLLITEVKLKANVPKKKRKKPIKTDGGQKQRELVARKTLLDNATLEKSRISSVKSETDKSSELKTSKSSEKTSSKSTTDKTTTSSLLQTSTSLSSSIAKTTTEKSTTDKFSTEKSSKNITSTQHSSTEKSSSDKTKFSAEKSSSDKTKFSTEKSSSDKTKFSTEKSFSDKTKTSAEKSSDGTKSSAEKSSDGTKSLTEKSSDGTKSLTEKSFSDKTKSSAEKSSDGTKSSAEKSSDGTKSLTEKSFSDWTKSSTEKSSSDRTKSSSDRTSTKESPDKTFTEDFQKKLFTKGYHHLLDDIEQQREQELRIVNQRADSREEAKKIPTPMASLDEMEAQYEKLLIVERVSTDTDIREKTARSRGSTKQPLSIVTQEQFDSLAELVKQLQEKFGTIGKPEFPENIQLMHDLRRGASLTDAMAALQLSARIEAAEKTLEQMMSLVTDLAVRKGVDIAPMPKKDSESPDTEVLFGAPGQSSQVTPKISRRSKAFEQPPPAKAKSTKTPTTQMERISIVISKEALQHIDSNYESIQSVGETAEMDADVPKIKPDWITTDELDEAMDLMYDSLLNTITVSTTKSASNADSALQIASRLERKIDDAININTRMDDLEVLVAEYAGQINTLDTGLSSYMTDYQEQLTQMQHDLEGGLESMAEAMANTGGDTAAVAELNSNITNLQMEFDTTNLKQKKLKDQQNLLFTDLESLWKEIEILRGTKSDREEAADALRDKAGLGALNGLVSQEQFDAVRGDFEQRIGAAYDKFNNQEIIWQKAIDDLLRELNEKADWLQVSSLRNDVNDNLDKLNNRINELMEIVGEPRTAAVTKKLFHDTACLSCASPAYMNLEETSLIPALPAFPTPGTRPTTIGAEDKSKLRGDGDHGLCYPGQQIPHPPDPRSHVCHRYCGGSHTVITGAISRAPGGMIITPALRRTATEIGSDGKVYMTEPERQSKPCLSCDFPKAATSQPSEDEEASKMSAFPSLDFLMSTGSMTAPQQDCISDTPPPPLDD